MNNNQNTHDLGMLDEFVLVDIDFTSYSGEISFDKLGIKSSDLPAKYTSSASLKLVDSKTLNRFGTIRANARAACMKYGTKFLAGFAVPVDKWKEVETTLKSVVTEFNISANDFVAKYDDYVNDRIRDASQDKPVQNAIRAGAAKHTREWVAGRFKASYLACFIKPIPGAEAETLKSVKGMYETILSEISLSAEHAVKSYINGKSSITRRIVSGTLNGICTKLESLSFIDSSLEPISKAIQKHVDFLNLPKTGNLPEKKQHELAMLLMLMSDQDKLSSLAKLLANQQKEAALVKQAELAELQKAEQEQAKLLAEQQMAEQKEEIVLIQATPSVKVIEEAVPIAHVVADSNNFQLFAPAMSIVPSIPVIPSANFDGYEEESFELL